MKETILEILVIDDEKDIYLLFEQQFKNEIKNNTLKFPYANTNEQAFI
ncbi:hypothetical protein [Candidatus Protochlamydia sp. W-9]|nr:hypothetical protein [Candidatus Protochlamydia sp. W-9]